jgi:hypothetical protein
MFQESHDSLPIWLSLAISELKMAANSTYWMAKLDFLWPGVGGMGKESKETTCLGLNLIHYLIQKVIPEDTYDLLAPTSVFPFRRSFPALIPERRTLIFEESSDFHSIR